MDEQSWPLRSKHVVILVLPLSELALVSLKRKEKRGMSTGSFGWNEHTK
jgi:hypothetical protein